jgi:hypothetical protein
MTTVSKKISALLPFVLLASCAGSTYGGVATTDKFVSLASVNDVKVSSCYLKTKVSAISGGPSIGSITASAHECDFFTNNDYKYATSTMAIIGHDDVQKGLYYLVNSTNISGYIYTDPAALNGHRALAKKMLSDDVDFITSIYNKVKDYSTWDSAAISSNGFAKVSVEYTDIGSTVGYNATTVKETASSKTQMDYYFTLDKTDAGYFFTDVIIREAITDLTTGGISYFNDEWNLALVDAYSDQTFNILSYTLALAGTDLSTLSSDALTQTL